jgi:hypothetical protein
MVYLQGSGASAVLVSQAADWEFAIDFDMVTVSALGDVWDTRLKGMMRFSGKLSGQFDTASTLAWDALMATTSRQIYVYPDRGNVAAYYSGLCWPKLTIKGGVGAIVSFESTIDGDGPLAKNP